MTGVSLDTSGEVLVRRDGWSGRTIFVRWSDLSPFEQGYVEALFREWALEKIAERCEEMGEEAHGDVEGYLKGRGIGFSGLAHETLAAIRKDCAAFGQTWRTLEPERGFAQGEQGGRDFWWMRQQGKLTDPPFPPLTPILSEDGKVRFQ